MLSKATFHLFRYWIFTIVSFITTKNYFIFIITGHKIFPFNNKIGLEILIVFHQAQIF